MKNERHDSNTIKVRNHKNSSARWQLLRLTIIDNAVFLSNSNELNLIQIRQSSQHSAIRFVQ